MTCPPPGDLPDPGTEPVPCVSSIAGGFFTTEPPRKPLKSGVEHTGLIAGPSRHQVAGWRTRDSDGTAMSSRREHSQASRGEHSQASRSPGQAQGPDCPAAPWVLRGWLPFFFSLSLISWEQEHCKYLTNPFSENRGNRIGSGLLSGKHNTVRPVPAAPAAPTL